MRGLRYFALISLLGAGLSGALYGQGGWRHTDRDNDRGGDPWAWRNPNQNAYQDGFNQGQYDRAKGHRYSVQSGQWRRGDSRYRNAYEQGYSRGYNSGYANGRNYPNGNNYPYGSRGRSGYGNQAYTQGLQDGRYDGENDFRTGHSYRPTEGSNYKHADRGYNSSFGDKNLYKQEYRNGYMAGYSQGYRR